MTKYELVGKIMSLGAESSGKLASSKMYAKDESVKLLDEYLALNIHNVSVPKGTLSDFEKWLDKKENESYCGLPSQYVLDKYKSLNAL